MRRCWGVRGWHTFAWMCTAWASSGGKLLGTAEPCVVITAPAHHPLGTVMESQIGCVGRDLKAQAFLPPTR